MKQRSIQSSEIPTIPVNGSAVMLDDRIVVMDNLDVSVNSDRAFDDKSLFPFRLALNTILPALLVMPIAFKLIGKEFFVPTTFNNWFGQPNTNEPGLSWCLQI